MTDFAEKERLTVVKFLSWEWCTFQIRYGFIFISLRSSKGTIPLLTPYWQSPLAIFRRLFSKRSVSFPVSNDGLAPECSFELFRCVLWTLESLVSSYKNKNESLKFTNFCSRSKSISGSHSRVTKSFPICVSVQNRNISKDGDFKVTVLLKHLN